MTTRVASVNLKFTLDAEAFEDGLRKVLAEHPDLVAIQEAGRNRDPIIRRVAHDLGYGWTRPESPNGDPVMPVMWRENRYWLRSSKAVRLAWREYVGHLPGRKTRLPASWATEIVLDDLANHGDVGVTVLLDYHLTAEVQYGAGYRKDLAHSIRVARHKREKRRLGRRLRIHKSRGRNTFAAGDSNFDGFSVRGFISCWDRRTGGTLGPRAVDVILAATRSAPPKTIRTPSDHKAVVVVYP